MIKRNLHVSGSWTLTGWVWAEYVYVDGAEQGLLSCIWWLLHGDKKKSNAKYEQGLSISYCMSLSCNSHHYFSFSCILIVCYLLPSEILRYRNIWHLADLLHTLGSAVLIAYREESFTVTQSWKCIIHHWPFLSPCQRKILACGEFLLLIIWYIAIIYSS